MTQSNTKKHIIFGVDILPMSSPEAKNQKLALAKYNVKTSKYEIIPKIRVKDLIFTTRKEKPAILATDNLFELAKDTEGVIELAQLIPETKIVQTTGSPKSGLRKLVNIARKYNIWSTGKPNPEESAVLCAKLAALGVGQEVVCFENEIRVIVRRVKGRTSKGGWSQQRYERNVKAAIRNTSRAFEEKIRHKDFSYDLYKYRSHYVYIIDLNNIKDRFVLKSIAKKFTGSLAGVFIQNIPKEKLEYIPLTGKKTSFAQKNRGLIVGLDPGTTTGIALIDMWTGRILALDSKREFSTSQIVRKIGSFGRALIVASDVRPAPHLVKKIARIFGAELETPHENQPSRTRKREIALKYLEKNKITARVDNHARDALFAAVTSYSKHNRQIDKIKEEIEQDRDLRSSFVEISRKIIQQGINLTQSIEQVREKKEKLQQEEKEEPKVPKIPEKPPIIEELEATVLNQELQIKFLREEKNRIEETLQKTKKKFKTLKLEFEKYRKRRADELAKSKRIKEKDNLINLLNQQINQVNRRNERLHNRLETMGKITQNWTKENFIPLKPIEKLSEESLLHSENIMGLYPGDIILLQDPTGGGAQTASILVEKKIQGVIIPDNSPNLSHQAKKVFEAAQIPVLSLPIKNFDVQTKQENVVKRLENLHFMPKKILERLLYEEKIRLMKKRTQFLKKLKEREDKSKKEEEIKTEKEEDPILQLIDDYQQRRDKWLEIDYDEFEDKPEFEED